jgi:NAD(P)-dependent dehydrogenase (short-subunit alcohol dehydrogenase family)
VAGRVAGKVAFITGAARGQGRAHAIRLAEEGADIIAVDISRDYDTVAYPMATEADLAETVKAVEALDRRIVAHQADVRDTAALKAAVEDGVSQLGRLDIVCANAGICTSSTAGIKGLPFFAPYVAAKHGVVGIARTMANELGRHRIRVNTVHPTGVDTPMGQGLSAIDALRERQPETGSIYQNTLPVENVDPRDVSNAVLFLASDEARYVTGLEFTVDAGNTIR